MQFERTSLLHPHFNVLEVVVMVRLANKMLRKIRTVQVKNASMNLFIFYGTVITFNLRFSPFPGRKERPLGRRVRYVNFSTSSRTRYPATDLLAGFAQPEDSIRKQDIFSI